MPIHKNNQSLMHLYDDDDMMMMMTQEVVVVVFVVPSSVSHSI
jgi:hypothetical protein